MSGIEGWTFAAVCALLGLGTFGMRYALIGLFAERRLPPMAERALKYVPAAVMPAIAAPLLLTGADGSLGADPVRLGAAAIGVAAGILTRNILATIGAGMAAFWLGQALF